MSPNTSFGKHSFLVCVQNDTILAWVLLFMMEECCTLPQALWGMMMCIRKHFAQHLLEEWCTFLRDACKHISCSGSALSLVLPFHFLPGYLLASRSHVVTGGGVSFSLFHNNILLMPEAQVIINRDYFHVWNSKRHWQMCLQLAASPLKANSRLNKSWNLRHRRGHSSEQKAN